MQQLEGVWQGTLGKQEIQACFSIRTDPNTKKQSVYGGYYIQNQLTTYELLNEPKEQVESHKLSQDDNNEWQLESISKQLLIGERINLETKASDPLKLRLAGKNKPTERDDAGCFEEPGFNQKRVNVLLDKIKIHDFGYQKKHYQELTLKNKDQQLDLDIQYLQLDVENLALEALNKTLKKTFVEDLYFDMSCTSLGMAPTGGYHENKEQISFWNDEWITVKSTGNHYCGGAYPDLNTAYNTYNLSTAKIEELWTWFKDKRQDANVLKDASSETKWITYKPNKKLLKTILAYRTYKNSEFTPNNQDNDGDIVKERMTFNLGLSDKGIVFFTAFEHAVQAYDETMVVPYEALLKHLTKEGRAKVDAIMSSQKN